MSPRIPRDGWAIEVGQVFHTAPRIGRRGSLWIHRAEFDSLHSAFQRPANQICIDGPSGTGKTSLAWTYLELKEIPYVYVPITKSLTWQSFCRELARPSRRNTQRSHNLELEGGVSSGLPTAKFKVTLGRTHRPSDDEDYIKRMSETWNEHDVVRLMAEEDTSLLVDDFERANAELQVRIADLCKVLISQFPDSEAKVIVVGTEDTYRRLFSELPSLEHRIAGVSLGPFSDEGESWKFLTRGFEKLNLLHPANSKYLSQQKQVSLCIKAIYEAADGLPKSLNQLGQDIALEGENRKAVSAHDIVKNSHKMASHNWANHRRNYKPLLDLLERSRPAITLIRVLYQMGICRIHEGLTVADFVCNELSQFEVDSAFNELVDVKFMVRTGPTHDIIYVTNPTAAHALGVVLSSPERFKGAAKLVESYHQYQLAFPRRELTQLPPQED